MSTAEPGFHWWRDKAACAAPYLLELVDDAFEHPGGRSAKMLERLCCRHCPVKAECLAEAMVYPEHGVWAGTSPKARTQHGAPNWQERHRRQRIPV